MEVGQTGVPGQDVQSPVEVETGPDPDLVQIHHLNMEETTALDPPLKTLIATLILAQVSNHSSLIN